MNIPIKLRRGTAAAWTAANPILASGEIGLETDVYPYKFKIGDGVTHWNSLGYMTSGGGGVAVSAGTNSTSTSTVVFSNSNGVSFGMDTNAVITATVKTDYQSSGNYLTTAALSSQTLAFSLSGNIATTNSSRILNGGYALAGGNGVTLQQSNNTISFSVATNYQSTGNYLTTADLSQNSSKYFQNWKISGNTAGTTSSAQGTDFWLAGGNGVTLSGSSNTISFSVATNYQSQGAYLTTAALSQDSSKYAGTGVTTAGGAGFSATLNTAGLSVSIPSWLTTADLSANSSKYVQNWKLTGNTAGTTSSAQGTDLWFSGGNNVTISGSSNSLVFSVGNYITTADLSQNSSKYVQNWKLTGNTAGTTSSAQGTDLWLAGGNGVTISGSSNTLSFSVATNYQSTGNYLTTADLSQNSSKYVQNWKLTGNTAGTTSSAQGTDLWFSGGNSITVSGSSNSIVFSVGNYITTARASTDAIGLNTAQTNVTWTVNSSGLSLNAGGYAGTGFTSAGANITMGGTLNTAGLSLSLSVAPPGAAAENNWHNLLGANTAGNTTASGSTIGLSGINLTLSGTNNSVINISAPATSSISGTGQVSVSVNASTISIGVPVMSMNYWDNGQGLNPSMSSVTVSSNSTFNVFTKGTAQNTVHIFPIGTLQGSIAPNTMFLQMAHSATGNSSSGPKVFTISFGVYTMNASTLSLLNSATTAVSLAANANNSTGYSGTRWISFHSSLWSFAPTFFNDVEYWGAMVYSTGGNNSAAQTAGFLGFYPYQTIAGSGVFGVSQTTGSSQGPYPWLGVHSVSSAIPTSINMADITRQGASANFVPFIVLNNLTSYF